MTGVSSKDFCNQLGQLGDEFEFEKKILYTETLQITYKNVLKNVLKYWQVSWVKIFAIN